MEKISIIIPIYKAEKYLKTCLDSVINQTYDDLEIILVNDGSPDDSGKICEEYSKIDNRIIVCHKENGGVSSARNKGLELASGEYIIFVDADDYLDKRTVSEVIKNKDKDTDLLIYGVNKFDELGLVKFGRYKEENINIDKFANNYWRLKRDIDLNSLWNKLYHKKIIDINRIRFDESVKIGEDLCFNMLYFVHCKNIKVIDKYLYNYRISDESAMAKYSENLFKQLINQYVNQNNMIKKLGSREIEKDRYVVGFNDLIFAVLENTLKSKKSFSSKLSEIKEMITNEVIIKDIKKYRPDGITYKVLYNSIRSKNPLLVYCVLNMFKSYMKLRSK